MNEILIVEDDKYIGNVMEEALSLEGYKVSRAYCAKDCLHFLKKSRPDLILLDLMLPDMDGEDIIESVKDIPVIVVSAKNSIEDKVNLLYQGASDYMTKPFSLKELAARVSVQLRSNKDRITYKKLEYEDLVLDMDCRIVQYQNKEVSLTKTECLLLSLLIQNSSQVLTKSFLLEKLLQSIPECSENSLKMHISNLRKKLRDLTGKDYIESVWGIGFKLNSI